MPSYYFRDYLNQALRNRFVCRLRSEAVQNNLLSEAELDFSHAVKVVQCMETVHKNTQTLKGPEPTVGMVDKVTQAVNLLPVGKLQLTLEEA